MYPQQPPPQRQVVKRGANHGLHVFLSIITCGLWAITGWPIAAAMGRKTVVKNYGPPQQYPPASYPSQGYQPPPGPYGPPQPPYGQQPPPPQQPPGQWRP